MTRLEKVVGEAVTVAFLWMALAGGGVILGADSTKEAADRPQVNGQENATAPAGGPSKMRKSISLPNYHIEPPDVVILEMLKMVPLPPYKIETYDVLQIHAVGTLVDQPPPIRDRENRRNDGGRGPAGH